MSTIATRSRNGQDPAKDPFNELLLGLRCLALDYRASETSIDGPWTAQCPLCFSLCEPEARPLTITRTGAVRCRGPRQCDPVQVTNALLSAAQRHEPHHTGGDGELAREATTWAPISLEAVLAGEHAAPLPSVLRRTDGHCLLYPGRTHALHAEPEALKSWLALKACEELISAGESALFLDFEDAPASVAARLLALGVEPHALDELFVYIRPDEPLADLSLQDLEHALTAKPSLAVIDGLTEAFSCQGLSPLDNGDVAKWLDLLPRRLVRTGAAVLMLDHVVKDREQRGRYAIGAQHKLAGVDVAYSMRVVEPFARGREGVVAIKVEKDRPGEIRAFAADGQAALLRARSEPNGDVRIKLEPPGHEGSGFRPTVLMERVSRRLEDDPGLSKRAVRKAAGGRASATDLALELLLAEDYVKAQRDGQATRHYSLRPYRETDDDRVPVSEPCPAGGSDTREAHRVPVSPSLKDTDAGDGAPDAALNRECVRTDPAERWTDDELQTLVDQEAT